MTSTSGQKVSLVPSPTRHFLVQNYAGFYGLVLRLAAKKIDRRVGLFSGQNKHLEGFYIILQDCHTDFKNLKSGR